MDNVDSVAAKEGSNRSHIIVDAIGSYLNGDRLPEKDRSLDAIELNLTSEIDRLKHDIQRFTDESAHKDEVIQMKDAEIKRIENIAGYYGQQSTTIIEKLAGISDALTRLVLAGPSQPSKEAVVVSDSGESVAKPKRSIADRLLGRNKETS